VKVKAIHLLRGNDGFSVELQLEKVIAGLGTDFDSSLNMSKLDGKSTSLDDLQMTVSTLPFFGSKRLVVVSNAITGVDKAKQEKLLKILESAPETSHLVLHVEDRTRWRKDSQGKWQQYWETLNQDHWLTKWVLDHDNAEIIDVPLPDEKAMPQWVMAEAKRQGGQFSPDAAAELCRHTSNDTGIAGQEISKLLMYVNFERPVSVDDVIACVSVEGSADVFMMLDMLMGGQKKEAQSMMHRLLDDSQPEMILGAVAHRFRQLIQVREVLDSGGSIQTLVKEKVIFNNQVDNYSAAARRYPMSRLKEFFARLLEMDVQSKMWFEDSRIDSIQVDLKTNLELLVMEL
jgi:DNA polymerase-3 subunit delta